MLLLHRVAIFLSLGSLITATPRPLTSVLLSDAVETHGAMALDGTPVRYWYNPSSSSTNSTRWVIRFMGGGWVENIPSSAQRAYNLGNCWIGSSRPECLAAQAPGNGIPGVNFTETMDQTAIPSCLGSRWCGGFFNTDPVMNPFTYDWNYVLIQYMDGGSGSGNNETITWTTWNNQEVPLYYRGWRNLNAILDDLIANRNLQSATDIIVSGDSAGGLASYWHADYFTERFTNSKVVAVPDSGFFFTDDSFPAWRDSLYWIATMMNSTDGLNQNCVNSRRSAGLDPLLCTRPEIVAPYIQTPVFVLNSRYDPALDDISGGENGNNITNVNRLGATLADLVNATIMNRPNNAAFLTSCHEHCGQFAQNQTGPFADFYVIIDGWTAIPAIMQWWAVVTGKQERTESFRNYWFQEATYPCSTCCSGGQK